MAMIQITKEFIRDIPILNVCETQKNEQALPTVVYYHGFNGEKESSLTIAYKIAENGYRVILPDSHLHGERQKNILATELDLSFWDIVIQNIKELAHVKEFLTEKNLSVPERIGIGGTSMGGITTYGALKAYDWIKVAVSLMGTPKMTAYTNLLIDEFNASNEQKVTDSESREAIEKLAKFDLSLHPAKLNERPLLIWHGREDGIVPSEHDQSFYEEVKSHYKNQEHIQFIHEKGRSHHISRLSIAETARWFCKYL